jgi:hypothetical protein
MNRSDNSQKYNVDTFPTGWSLVEAPIAVGTI